jgi:predicted SprT family Zn-dependent metalloprotease
MTGFDFFDGEEDTQSEGKHSTAPTFGDNLSRSGYREACEGYAKWAVKTYDVFDPVSLDEVDFQISTKLERAAGKAGRKRGELMMRFAYGAYEKWGWGEEIESIIRHELVHIRQYQQSGAKPGHGTTFKVWADEAEAPRHCKQFTEYEYLLFCTKCGEQTGGRHRKSKVITNPEDTNYVSPCCRAKLRSEKA